MNIFIKKWAFVLMIGSLSSAAALADEVLIVANVGDKTTQYRLMPERGDFVISYQANDPELSKAKIGIKNYQYVVRVANEIISFKKPDQGEKGNDCDRDSTLVRYTNDAGKVSSTQVCLFANTAQSGSLLNLISTISAAL